MADAHQSEYVPERDKRIAFLANFTGSAGEVVVTAEQALLWTDGRYFTQAAHELTDAWTLMKSGQPGVPTVVDWIVKNCPKGANIGLDG